LIIFNYFILLYLLSELRSKIHEKKCILRGTQELLSKDANEISNKSTSALHVLGGSVKRLPRQNAGFPVKFEFWSNNEFFFHCVMQYLVHNDILKFNF
jgi:hypothetical protein